MCDLADNRTPTETVPLVAVFPHQKPLHARQQQTVVTFPRSRKKTQRRGGVTGAKPEQVLEVVGASDRPEAQICGD